MPTMDNDHGFTCDKCGQKFFPDELCYIGPKDRKSTTCSPFMMEWEELCGDCNNKEASWQ